MTRTKNSNTCYFLLVGMLACGGCAETLFSHSGTTKVVSLAMEAPKSLDAKRIVDVLEASTAHALGKPVTVDEQGLNTRTADLSGPIILFEKVIELEGLGKVSIPSIVCPGALASIHALVSNGPGLKRISVCVVALDGATRIYLTEATSGDAETQNSMDDSAMPAILARVGKAVSERLPEAYPLGRPEVHLAGRLSIPSGKEADATLRGVDRLAGAAGPNHDEEAHANVVPFVCFAPKVRGAAVRERPGGSRVVGTLDTDVIALGEEPSRDSFLHVTTREGREGWIKRSEVRWTPCPLV